MLAFKLSKPTKSSGRCVTVWSIPPSSPECYSSTCQFMLWNLGNTKFNLSLTLCSVGEAEEHWQVVHTWKINFLKGYSYIEALYLGICWFDPDIFLQTQWQDKVFSGSPMLFLISNYSHTKS